MKTDKRHANKENIFNLATHTQPNESCCLYGTHNQIQKHVINTRNTVEKTQPNTGMLEQSFQNNN